MKESLVNILASIMDRRMLWRLGRSLYLRARFDYPNDMRVNGEQLLQRQILSKFVGTNEKLVMFDIGANIGDWTWFLLEEAAKLALQDQLEIHAFEPIPSTIATLQGRLNTHQLGKLVHVIPEALSSNEGATDMYIVERNSGTNSLYQDDMSPPASTISVNTTTLSAYCTKANIGTIHFLKCDAEGHDLSILKGGKALLEEQRVMAFQFEYNHRWIYSRQFLKDVFDLAKTIPYEVGKVTQSRIEIYPNWHPELERFFEGNYILLHRDALHWFQVQRGNFDNFNTYDVVES